jgi:hypothetical protein
MVGLAVAKPMAFEAGVAYWRKTVEQQERETLRLLLLAKGALVVGMQMALCRRCCRGQKTL